MVRKFIMDEFKVYTQAELTNGDAISVEQAWAQAVPVFINGIYAARNRIHGDRPVMSEAVYEGITNYGPGLEPIKRCHTFRINVRVKNPEYVDA